MTTYSSDITNSTSSLPSDPRGMKWHKFLIYFNLWFGAICNLLLGFIYLAYLGSDNFNSWRYTFGGVAFVGISAIILGVYAIITRFKLAKFRTSAPGHLTAYLILVTILDAVVCAMEFEFSFSTVIISIVHIVLNCIYYNKRSDLFVC